MPDVVNSVVINYKSVGLDKVGADLKGASTAIDGLVVSSATAFKATTELENKFKGLQKSTSAYTTALGEARGAAMGLAAGIGPLGAVLGSFGPWGVAAAAGIGLVTSAFNLMSEGAEKMGAEAVKLQQFSDITGLTTTQVRGLSEAGQEVGVSAEAVKKGLEKFTVGLADVREGSGDLFQQLKAIDEQLAIQMSQTRNSGEALDLLTKAYNSTADATTRAKLAKAAFGKAGLEVGLVLGVLTEGVDKYSAATEKSLGVTADMTKKISDQSKRIIDLRGDVETMNAALYTPEVLDRQERFLEGQKRIAAAMLELKASGAGFAPDIGGVGGFGTAPPQFSVPQEVTGEAGRGGMARGAAAAAATAAAEVAALEQKWIGVSAETRKASEIAESMIPVYQAVGGAAQRTAQFDADITAELIKQKTAKEALLIAADKYIASEEKALAAVKATTQSMEEQNELAGARDIQDEKRIASQQAYNKVIQELGDTEKGREEALKRSDAVAESYRIKMQKTAESSGDLAKSMILVVDASGKFVQQMVNANTQLQGSVGYAGHLSNLVANLGKSYDSSGAGSYPAGSQSSYTQPGAGTSGSQSSYLSSPGQMTGGSFAASPLGGASYRGGGTGKRISTGNFNPADYYIDPVTGAQAWEAGYGAKKQAAELAKLANMYELNIAKAQASGDPGAELAALQARLGYVQGQPETAGKYQQISSLQSAIENLTKATDSLGSSTDDLNATNQELLSPYYTQDPRTSHIGFRSQGMANGGYVDVPGGYSANDNMLATIPVASGERIYVDPMAVKRGTGGGGTTINITTPIMFNGPANRDEVGRTVYQTMQQTARSIASAQR